MNYVCWHKLESHVQKSMAFHSKFHAHSTKPELSVGHRKVYKVAKENELMNRTRALHYLNPCLFLKEPSTFRYDKESWGILIQLMNCFRDILARETVCNSSFPCVAGWVTNVVIGHFNGFFGRQQMDTNLIKLARKRGREAREEKQRLN